MVRGRGLRPRMAPSSRSGQGSMLIVAAAANLLHYFWPGPLDDAVRISDKSHYVSPTRGQLGNALKCLWAAPFVVSGERGLVEVAARGVRHRVEVSLDRIN